MRSLLRLTSASLVLFAAVAAVACNTTDTGTIKLVTGEETDTFTKAPAPTTLSVYAWTSSTNKTTIADKIALPTSDIDLGSQDETAVATLQIEGNDASGANVVAGASLALQYGALSGGTLPVFVQRTNEWARLPSPPTDARQSAVLAIVSGEFLLIAGGTGSAASAVTTQIYDFAQLAPVSGPPALPFVPLSLAVIGTVGLAIGQDTATYYDFSQDATKVVTLPSGYTWSDVAGGQVVYAADSSGTLDTVFVTGGTRTQGAATAAILEIDATDASDTTHYPIGLLHWLTLSQPRLGATATWVAGKGLVVTGGSDSAAGVEIVTPVGTSSSGSSAAVSAFPPDPSIGAGAALLSNSSGQLLVAGGITPTGQDAGVRVLDLSCAQSCGTMGTTVWGKGLAVPLTSASVFTLGSGPTYRAMVVGNELVSGLTHAYLLNSADTSTVLPTKVPHTNASAIASPLGFGSVLLFGGSDAIESLFPPQD